ILFFTAALIYRANNELPNITILIVLEGIGVILLLFAGWMGGTLVYRNQIGVDPRYADAGKWKEEYYDETEGEVEVGSVNELKINQMKLVHVGAKRVVIARSEEGYVAFDDYCTHRGGSLAGGAMICGTVQCPWHGSQFSVTDGTVKAGPAKMPIVTYSLREESGRLYLTV
ncbi:MAG: Rieske (2Fe-2S) protein, partial [Sphingobacteriales bacterium]